MLVPNKISQPNLARARSIARASGLGDTTASVASLTKQLNDAQAYYNYLVDQYNNHGHYGGQSGPQMQAILDAQTAVINGIQQQLQAAQGTQASNAQVGVNPATGSPLQLTASSAAQLAYNASVLTPAGPGVTLQSQGAGYGASTPSITDAASAKFLASQTVNNPSPLPVGSLSPLQQANTYSEPVLPPQPSVFPSWGYLGIAALAAVLFAPKLKRVFA